jgi:phytoene synthase
MAGIYLRLLQHISAQPAVALSQRMSLPASEKALVAARCLTGMTRRRASRHGPGGAAAGPETITPAPWTPS